MAGASGTGSGEIGESSLRKHPGRYGDERRGQNGKQVLHHTTLHGSPVRRLFHIERRSVWILGVSPLLPLSYAEAVPVASPRLHWRQIATLQLVMRFV